MPSLDLSELLHDLIATGDETAIYAGIKALGKKDPLSLSRGELDALNTVWSTCGRGGQASKAADAILKAQPHCYVAEW